MLLTREPISELPSNISPMIFRSIPLFILVFKKLKIQKGKYTLWRISIAISIKLCYNKLIWLCRFLWKKKKKMKRENREKVRNKRFFLDNFLLLKLIILTESSLQSNIYFIFIKLFNKQTHLKLEDKKRENVKTENNRKSKGSRKKKISH